LRRDWETLDDLVGIALSRLEGRLHAHVVKVTLPDDLPAIHVDAGLITQVLSNLLDNAVRHTPPGTHVAITARVRGTDLEISVEDDGPGLPPGDPDRLFVKFQRGREEGEGGGAGLGLAICRDIIDLHGGTIKAETAADAGGVGVTFRVMLPLQAAPRAVHVDKVREVKESSRADLRSRLAGTRVLIVDDDPDAREVVAAILRHYGASVIVATSVSTALVALRREQVDVMVADLGMPIEDGYDLIRHVRSSEIDKIARMPAAALTAYTTEEDRDRVLAAGFQFHLAKPVDPAVLVATVERLRGETLSVH
jgi:CheY-like chemotaxis protein